MNDMDKLKDELIKMNENNIDGFDEIQDKETGTIYIIPIQSKPITIVYEGMPCPILPEYRCEYSKFKEKDDEICIECTAIKCKLE